MKGKSGIIERYPKASNRELAILLAYPVIVIGANLLGIFDYPNILGISPGGLFWIFGIFGGLGWAGTALTCFLNAAYRVGYSAAVDDVLMAASPLIMAMSYGDPPMTPGEFDKTYGEAIEQLRPWGERTEKT